MEIAKHFSLFMYLMSFRTTEWEFLLLILKIHCVAFKDFYISISLVKVSSELLPEFTRTCLKNPQHPMYREYNNIDFPFHLSAGWLGTHPDEPHSRGGSPLKKYRKISRLECLIIPT